MELYRYVGNQIKELRTTHGGKGISQEELAKAIDVTPNTVSRWETATYRPDLEDLDRVARFFGVSILDLFPEDERPRDQGVAALLRAANALPDEDVRELKRFAEFRRAQHVLSRAKSKSRARKEAG